jgi:actin-related protein
MFPGLVDRLQSELNALAPSGYNVKVSECLHACSRLTFLISATAQRKYQTFIGATQYASQPRFRDRCITKELYDEVGDEIVGKIETNSGVVSLFLCDYSYRLIDKLVNF